MHKSLGELCASLDTLANVIVKQWGDERTLCEALGWNFPSITRHDLAWLAKGLSIRIKEVAPDNISNDLDAIIKTIPPKLQILQQHTVPQMFNSNGPQAIPAYVTTIEWITSLLVPIIGWQVLDSKAMPAPIAKRLRSIQSQLDDILPEKQALETQIKLIQEATLAAESLPTDLEALKKARTRVDNISNDSAKLFSKIEEHSQKADSATRHISAHQMEAEKLVQQCSEAYRITTSTGLAGAFDQRATRLKNSVWLWVAGLLLALATGGVFGYLRFESLLVVLKSSNPQWGIIWIHIVLSLLSFVPSVWFAWLATKQIGQRFRLSEDYAFKASVAKAYEGYRREAARIDEAFEARLFGSALTRLEEAPLRLIETDSHGSPWHELVSSQAFHKALNTVPELRDKFIDIAKTGLSRVNGSDTSKAQDSNST